MIAPPRLERAPPFFPFQAGAPRFGPALNPIDPETWLTPDTEAHVIDWKQALLDQPELTYRCLPQGREAAREAAQAVGKALHCETGGSLIAASRRVSDDLVVMTPDLEGQWRCTALTLTAPTFFSIAEVIGRDVAALHGPVPQAAQLSARISRVFSGLSVGLVLERFNWTLQYGADRFTPDSRPLKQRAATCDPKTDWTQLFLRVERQTIIKLEATGAILFTIRVCLDPVVALRVEDRPALAKAWRALGQEGRLYKGWAAYERLVGALFKAWGV